MSQFAWSTASTTDDAGGGGVNEDKSLATAAAAQWPVTPQNRSSSIKLNTDERIFLARICLRGNLFGYLETTLLSNSISLTHSVLALLLMQLLISSRIWKIFYIHHRASGVSVVGEGSHTTYLTAVFIAASAKSACASVSVTKPVLPLLMLLLSRMNSSNPQRKRGIVTQAKHTNIHKHTRTSRKSARKVHFCHFIANPTTNTQHNNHWQLTDAVTAASAGAVVEKWWDDASERTNWQRKKL